MNLIKLDENVIPTIFFITLILFHHFAAEFVIVAVDKCYRSRPSRRRGLLGEKKRFFLHAGPFFH